MARIAMVVTNACAPDPRVERHALWLTEMGHDVEIHAWDRRYSNPIHEEKNGYKIVRYQFRAVTGSMPIRTWLTKKKFISNLELNHDLLILNDTDTGNVKFQGPIILDIHDLAHTWPLMRGNTPLHKFASMRMLSGAKRIIRKADEIIVSAPNFGKWIGELGRDSTCVMNRRNPTPIQVTSEKVIGYFGRIRELEPIMSLIQSAKKADFKVILAGDGVEVENVLSKNPGIDYRGPFTEEGLPDLMREISVMYAMYNENRANIKLGAIPTKMFDAAAFGIPSVVNQNTPMGDLCEKEGLGKTAPYGDIEKISDAMLQAHGMKISKIKGEDKSEFIRVVRKLLD